MLTTHVAAVAQKQKLTVTLTAPARWASGTVRVTTEQGATVFDELTIHPGQLQVSVVARGFWATIGRTVLVTVRGALDTGEQVVLEVTYVVALDNATHVTMDLVA